MENFSCQQNLQKVWSKFWNEYTEKVMNNYYLSYIKYQTDKQKT
jgi:hypothetical protein